ncbi:uncharacterized protein V6R79_009688 [Siganus canaliculatus]
MADSAVASGGSLSAGGRGSAAKAVSSPSENYHLARRRTLQVVVSALLTECGFESAEKAAVETLTEMMQSFITEIGRCAKAYCEHTARSVPTLSDTVVTLIEMGFNADTLPVYAKRSQRMVITAPPVTNPPVTPKALSAGQKRTHPAHIPSHFPEFPDPHTYIKTPRTCVRLPGGEREGSESEERRGAGAHSLHGQDRRDPEPLQGRHHCLPTDCSTTQHHPVSQRPPALRAGTADSGRDGLFGAGRPDRQREHGRKHHH